MAYVTITLSDGTQREVSNLDDIPFNEAVLFNSEVKRLIRENKTAGKLPFDGIDWPKGVFNIAGAISLTYNSLFQEALKEQISATHVYKEKVFQKDAMDKMEATLDFVNRISIHDYGSVNPDLMLSIHEGFGERVYDEEFMGYVPLETQICLAEDRHTTGQGYRLSTIVGARRESGKENWQKGEDTLTAESAKILAKWSSRGTSLLSNEMPMDIIETAVMRSDWSKVSDEDIDKSLDWLSRKVD